MQSYNDRYTALYVVVVPYLVLGMYDTGSMYLVVVGNRGILQHEPNHNRYLRS